MAKFEGVIKVTQQHAQQVEAPTWVVALEVLVEGIAQRTDTVEGEVAELRQLDEDGDPTGPDFLFRKGGQTTEWRCPSCGDNRIEASAYIQVNGGAVTDGDGPTDDYWCPTCEDHMRRVCEVEFATERCLDHKQEFSRCLADNKE